MAVVASRRELLNIVVSVVIAEGCDSEDRS